jgi:hypothetical protein
MRRFLLAIVVVLLSPCAWAQKTEFEKIGDVWSSCRTLMDSDDWLGWRRDFGNGYGDTFELWDREGAGVSALKVNFMIDGIATETQTSCFRKDGGLTFVLVEMLSPNQAANTDQSSLIKREGRIYVSPSHDILRITGQIADEAGRKLSNLDSSKYQLARGCWALDLHLSLDRARDHLVSEQGDIEGKHPADTANAFDWCAIANPQ